VTVSEQIMMIRLLKFLYNFLYVLFSFPSWARSQYIAEENTIVFWEIMKSSFVFCYNEFLSIGFLSCFNVFSVWFDLNRIQ
jgi:hypothetical protein